MSRPDECCRALRAQQWRRQSGPRREEFGGGRFLSAQRRRQYSDASLGAGSARNAVAIADSFLSAKQTVFPDDRRLTMDRRQMIEEICGRSWSVRHLADRQMARGKVRQTIDDDRNIQAWFDTLPDPPLARRLSLQPGAYGNDGFFLNVRADRWGIANIADAVEVSWPRYSAWVRARLTITCLPFISSLRDLARSPNAQLTNAWHEKSAVWYTKARESYAGLHASPVRSTLLASRPCHGI